DGEAGARAAVRALRGAGATFEARVELTPAQVAGLDEQAFHGAEPAAIVAREVLLARQLLHREAKPLDVATEQQHDESRDSEYASLPALVEDWLARLACDRRIVLSAAAHVADRAHTQTVPASAHPLLAAHTIPGVSAIADYRAASEA